ncbi:PPE family protein [Mycobacterium helveticum]|uniref:PPE family protein n=1 Tax=Mycobacterium helveticum TaxID=2592811 RepID=A0A557XSG9_9MYCO|nr:PPE family protein [Mycobacterium helveticum]TVS88234.1 PPE family protein [Mycobacterium helveticum]TVS88882.1 PPE family protein [Mycobacterium helveticum]
MDFGMLPPEVNSARMYAGPGSGPLLTAAAAWDGLAAELRVTAASCDSVLSGLVSSWTGPASASMVGAVAPYVAWMNTTAAQSEHSAAQARAAAAAYEAAFAMTVPPQFVAANRSLVMSLIATNFLGQNTPAIAAAEAQYGEMWARDAAAMYGYAGASASASRLTPLQAPQQLGNPAGPVGQTAAVQAATTSAAANTQTTLQEAMSALPQTLQGLASPLSSASFLPSTSTLTSVFNSSMNNLKTVLYPASIVSMMPMRGLSMANMSKSLMSSVGAAAKAIPAAGAALSHGVGAGALGPLGTVNLGVGGSPGAVSAGLGRAVTVGALSVPQAWSPAPIANPFAAGLPGVGFGSLPSQAAASMGLPPMTPITNMATQGMFTAAPRYGFRPAVLARPPAAG